MKRSEQERERRLHRCCFTGHRPDKLTKSEGVLRTELEYSISVAIGDGYTTFITGMACGVDIWAGEIILRRKQNDARLHLIAAIPFRGCERRWPSEWKQRYYQLLEGADLVHCACPQYEAWSYQQRNEWMVDRSSRVIAVYNYGVQSGTKNTVEYAWRNSVPVVVISG